MGTRPRAKSDMKVAQGKRRDAYFDQLRRISQGRKATPAASQAPGVPAAAPTVAAASAEPTVAPAAESTAQS